MWRSATVIVAVDRAMRRPPPAIATVLAAAALVVGCGSDGDGTVPLEARVPAEHPTALATGTWGLFAAETDRGVVTRRTVSGEVVSWHRLEARVTALASANDHLAAVLGGTNEVVLLRSKDLAVVARTRLAGPPGAIAAIGFDGRIVIADEAGDRLVRLAIPSLRVVRSVPLPARVVTRGAGRERDRVRDRPPRDDRSSSGRDPRRSRRRAADAGRSGSHRQLVRDRGAGRPPPDGCDARRNGGAPVADPPAAARRHRRRPGRRHHRRLRGFRGRGVRRA